MEAPSQAMAEPAAAGRSKEHWVVLALAVTGLLAFVAAGLLLEPDARGYGTHEKLGLQPCLPMAQWGIPCPGCGVTTAVTLAAHGELWRSFLTQPLGILVAAAILAFGVWAPIAHVRRRDLWEDVRGVSLGRWFWVLMGIVTAAWAWKLVAVMWLGRS